MRYGHDTVHEIYPLHGLGMVKNSLIGVPDAPLSIKLDLVESCSVAIKNDGDSDEMTSHFND